MLQAMYNGAPIGLPASDYRDIELAMKQAFKDGTVPPGGHIDVKRVKPEEAAQRASEHMASILSPQGMQGLQVAPPQPTIDMVGLTEDLIRIKSTMVPRKHAALFLVLAVFAAFVFGFHKGKQAYSGGGH